MRDNSLIILAGGKSSRMGRNKAFVKLDNETFIERVIGELGHLFSEIIVVTNSPELYGNIGQVKVVTDIYPQRGPLSGIHAGLVKAKTPRSLVVACDMPFVSSQLALFLIQQSEGWDVTVPLLEGKYQPLFAVYSKNCINPVEKQLESDNYKITSFYKVVSVKEVDLSEMPDPDMTARAFFNVNTPAELQEAQKMTELQPGMAKTQVRAVRWKAGEYEHIKDPLVIEKPLTIYLNEQEIVTLLCSPEYLEELAVGFLVSEGLIKGSAEDLIVKVDQGQGIARVTSAKVSMIAEQTFLKRYITTGCGKGTSFYNLADAQSSPVISELQVAPEKILELMGQVQQASTLFRETGGVHLTALCSQEKIQLCREDIGRHNALDKIVGRCFLEGLSIDNKMLFTTGRLSSEILIKVAKLGVPILVSRSAPTSLAVELAGKLGVTLIGFARAGRMNVYANTERIHGGEGI